MEYNNEAVALVEGLIDNINLDYFKSRLDSDAFEIFKKKLEEDLKKEDRKNAIKDYKKREAQKGFGEVDDIHEVISRRPHYNDGKYSKDADSFDKKYAKPNLKRIVEYNRKHPHKVIGGYKLEAAMILIEALNTLLNE